MANSFPASGLAYADAFSVGNASSVNSSLYVCSSCVQAVRIEHNYDQTNLHHNTLWLRASNNGAQEAASIGFTVVNGGGDHHRANIAATGNAGQVGGNLALYTRNNSGADTLGLYIDHAGNTGIGTASPNSKFHVACGQIRVEGQPSDDITGCSGYYLANAINNEAFQWQMSCNFNLSLWTYSAANGLNWGLRGPVITQTGRVGISTTSPSTPLQIRSNTIDSGGAGLSVFGYDGAVEFTTTRAESPANAAIYLYNRPTSGTNGTGTGISFRASSTNTADRPQGGIYSSWTDSTDATRTAKFYFDLVNSGTYATRMTLLGNGNLGLGTTSPNTPLHIVAGSSDGVPILRICATTSPSPFNWAGSIMSPYLCSGRNFVLLIGQEQSTKNSGYIGYNHTGTAGSNSNFLTFGHYGNDNLMNLMADGKLGIGTTSPNAVLDIRGDNADNAVTIRNTNGSSYSAIGYYNCQGTLKAALGIGNNSASAPFANNAYVYTPASTDFLFYIAGSERMRIRCDGNIGVATTSPSYKLHINGTFYAAGSSIKYKEGICNYDIDSCLFMCLKPVAYQYKDEFKHLGKELKSDIQIGLIAEDVAEVMPELAILVNEEDEKVVRNVDYEKLSIVLLAEVQKLRKEVDELKK